MHFLWPFFILGVGAAFFIGMVAGGHSFGGLAVPGSVITTVGLILFFQNLFNIWETWAYAWALIPCFAGTGTILAGIFERNRSAVIGGGWTLFSGLVMFAIFGSFLGGSVILSQYWPVLLIALGLVLLFTGILRKR